jgi:hypothetical protein
MMASIIGLRAEIEELEAQCVELTRAVLNAESPLATELRAGAERLRRGS